MTKPLAIFPDPIVETLRVLRADFMADPATPAGTTISQRIPERTASTATPSVLVADDGDAYTGKWPVSEHALLRVSVWDRDAHRAGRVAARARAYLLAYRGDAKVRGYGASPRPLGTTDPDDGTPISSFTITARLKAE